MKRRSTNHSSWNQTFEPWVEQEEQQQQQQRHDAPPANNPPREPTQQEIDDRIAQLQRERKYHPLEYDRELHAANGNAETALGNVVKKLNGIDERRFEAEAKALLTNERDVEALRNQVKTLTDEKKAATDELTKVQKSFDDLNGTVQQRSVDELLEAQGVTDYDYVRYVLGKEGYDVKAEGEGDQRKLVLKKGDETTDYGAVVNADFRKKYPALSLKSDDPIRSTSKDKTSFRKEGESVGQAIARQRMGSRHPSNQQQQK